MSQLDFAKRSVRGSVVLFAGNFGALAVSAVISLLLARLLGPSEYGEYTLILLVPSFLSIFLGFGVTTSIIRYSAYSISQGREDEARRYTINGIRFLWLTGAALTLVEYALAGPLSSSLLNRPALTPYVQAVSVAVFGIMMLNTASTTAIAWSMMGLSSATNLAQAFVKLALAPLLILLGFGVVGALLGHIVSYFAAGAIGTAALYLSRLRGAAGGGKFLSDTKALLRFGRSAYIGTMSNSLATYFASFVLAFIASYSVIGDYQAAANFAVPISTMATALTSSLFTAFTSYDGVGGDSRAAFKHAYRFVAFLLAPVVFFFFAAAGPLMHVVYTSSYDKGVPYLQLLALAYLPIAFGYSVHGAFFMGFGKPRFYMALQTVAAVVLVVSAPLLAITASLGVDGIIYANLLSDFAAWAVGTYLADRYMKARLDVKANGAILLASVVACGATLLAPKVPFSNALTLLVDIVVFFLVYLTLTPLLGAVKEDDLDVMRHTFSGLSVISDFFGLLLKYVKFVISIRRRGR